MLAYIKTLLNIPTSDDGKNDILNYLIEICSQEYMDITHTNDIIESIIVQMVVCRFNLLGDEMLHSESYTGMTFNYLSDYPDNLQKQIITHRKMRMIG